MPAITTTATTTTTPSSSATETSVSAPSSAATVVPRALPSLSTRSSTVPTAETTEQPPPHPRLDPVHLACQEASYIAASHRADSPLAARQSAAQASALHALRTGKRLFVSRVLVERRRDYPEERHDVVVRAAKVHARAVWKRQKIGGRDLRP
ncbi:hypothetical protein AMAG_12300 [Allomyces macrogynus ATCC 38327]|uniref:Uncharacterized protein n=1 Tax=Allomyces macrogynus (strain ATCC 38327) TaxID=578462 RepID=A0A0L0SY21_ALLM3|nr:hypothetical protein AMAG_12300 [Allomyces macrogynus ATCC 38327]|eukprot:KNE67229.1 hypothetical protein AMAG_12300 [Allomyces macrogynus ATCC 38327]